MAPKFTVSNGTHDVIINDNITYMVDCALNNSYPFILAIAKTHGSKYEYLGECNYMHSSIKAEYFQSQNVV